MAKKRFRDLKGWQKVGVVAGSVVQFGLLGAALWDIFHRPPEKIRGNRWAWVGISFINYFGPVAYFSYGRRR